MPRLQASPRNVVNSDSEDELAMQPTSRRQTRSVTNSPRKARSQPGGLLSSSQENATPADTHNSSAQDGEADDEDEKKDVLATQSPSVRNARIPKRRGASARKSPIESSSQRKGAGKRQPLGTSRAAGSSFPVAASRFDWDVSDSELSIPGLPEGRKWLHSVRLPLRTPTKQSAISDFFKPHSPLQKKPIAHTIATVNPTTIASDSSPSNPPSDTDPDDAQLSSPVALSALAVSRSPSPSGSSTMANKRPGRAAAKKGRLLSRALTARKYVDTSEASDVSDFAVSNESSQGESSHVESDESSGSPTGESSGADSGFGSHPPPKRRKRLTDQSSPLSKPAPKQAIRKRRVENRDTTFKGADRVLFPELNNIKNDDDNEDGDAMQGVQTGASSDTPMRAKAPKRKPTGTQAIKPESYVYKNGLALHEKPISKIEDIFADMTDRALTKMTKAKDDKTFLDFLQHMNGRKLRVATMCSGTESPVLALNLVSEALKSRGHNFEIDHKFSAEIVPFKQAYIERNFSPPIIFRDIKELSIPGAVDATTAYGSKAKIPDNIDILITGFSCVDFSGLNSTKRVIEECGESGDTFFAMRDYARIFRPKIIILENVMGAPWARISDYMAAIGYACKHHFVDTKNYYVPHTRQRGYMMCIDMYEKVKNDKRTNSEKKLIRELEFGEYMKKFGQNAIETYSRRMDFFKRPASSSVEAFLLDEDDPRVIAGRAEMTKGNAVEGRKRVVDWTRCQGRHEDYRFRMGLGARRYLTNWEDGGTCTPRDNWWHDWWKAQVERIWDHMEMSYLRAMVRGYDLEYKFRIIDFSQNIDRSLDTGGSGLTGCVTPTGIPYSSMRGGPLIGVEALALQGLPVDSLILTRESQAKLQDLAGNAMSSTVVGAAILSALIAKFEVFERGDGIQEAISVPDITQTIDDPKADSFTTRFDAHIPLSAAAAIKAANQSFRACYCEGRSGITVAQLQKCKACGHTTCIKCGISPKHNYAKISPDRIAPSEFEQQLKNALPMKVLLAGISIDDIVKAREDSGIKFSTADTKAFELSMDHVAQALESELRFHSLKRTEIWVVSYESTYSRLDLVFFLGHAEWRLYAKPDVDLPANDALREALQYPIARMRPTGDDLVTGQWQIWIPKAFKFNASVEGLGVPVPSFHNVLGIASAADSFVFPQYEITIPVDAEDYLEVDLSGVYTLQEDCGMSQGSLHVKANAANPEKRTFLFHDPDRLGNQDEDTFIFSEDKRRLQHGEVRSRFARVDKKWRQTKFEMSLDGGVEVIKKGNKKLSLSEARHLDPMTCYVDGQWLDIANASLDLAHGTASGQFSRAAENFSIMTSLNDCREAHVVLKCEAALPEGEFSRYRKDHWIEIGELEQKQFFSEYAWLTEKARTIPGLDTWREVENQLASHRCATCAPAIPNMKWRLDEKRKIVPFEDPTEAAPFEIAMKRRPSPLVTQVCIDDAGTVDLKLAVNPQTLIHRAAAKLLGDDATSATLQWRLVTDYVAPPKMAFPDFVLKNNDADTPSSNPPRFKFTLRPEQQRSLHWMVQQEAENVEPFVEEEVEEASIPLLGWRAEGRASKAKVIRGGVLADQVGYGKTVTTLGLIDMQRDSDEKTSKEDVYGLIPIKATLILVPSQLPDQWYSEVRKFLPGSYKVTVLKSLASVDKYSLEDFQQADIIIASWTICEGDNYLFKLAQFAGVLELPEKAPARAQSAWYANAMKKVAANVEILKSKPSSLKKQIDSQFTEEGKSATDVEAYVPSKRLRGQAYQDYKEKLQLQKTRLETATDLFGQDAVKVDVKADKKPETKKEFTVKPRKDIFGLTKLTKTNSYKGMRSPIFEIFRFSRVVVDEYAYVAGEESLTIANLKASAKWVLSGTPPLQDFLDVKCMSRFLGINLGIDDFTAGVMNAQNIKTMTKNMTSGEEFRTFNQKQSFAWHQNRHKLAQSFLDKFVRQNIADIEAINGSVHIMPAILPAAERAIYLELQQLLAASDFKMTKGKRAMENDRMKRIRELLGQSDSVGEALMKCASHFTLDELHDGLNNAPDACAVIVGIRNKQLDALEIDLNKTLRQAEYLHLSCEEPCDQYVSLKRQVESNHYGDVDACNAIFMAMNEAEKLSSHDDWEEFYMTQEERDIVLAAEARAKPGQKSKAKATKKRKRDDSESDGIVSTDGPDDSQKLLPLLPYGRNGNVEYAHTALRDVTNILRKMVIEYVSRKRCLRFFDYVRNLQKHYTNLRFGNEAGAGCTCSKCEKTGLSPEEISILSQCGHTACDSCRANHEKMFYNNLAAKEECLVAGCSAINKQWQVIKAPELGVEDDSTRKGRHYGKKIEDIISLVKNIPDTEQVLLFVQFTDLLDKIVGAFKDKRITYLSLDKGDPAKTLTKFQTETGKEKSKVLILNIGDASAAGSNLTNANHIIFVSPYLTDREQTYKAAITQAVGRARRYGQTKAVHTYHFLSLKTIDVDTFESRNHVILDHENTTEPEYMPYSGFVKSMPMDATPQIEGLGSKWGSTVVTKGLLAEE
ncbi:hypothetical protein V495_04619 [Pseudogymnoascus sp. VKM F-4514 (FW-929)]|nr:hypothetical protein V495_04619 [Pseudogymnoascus sp. VKM F-4514 (FW-929)]KFY59125.1 hypothetical protein V497_04509 [Pseudogymnoascus sp. VKM F-4516 (FW-969)]